MVVPQIFNEHKFRDTIEGPQLTVVLFYTDWSEACKDFMEAMNAQQEINKTVKFLSLPAEDLPRISEEYNVAYVPTVLMFVKGVVVARIDGAHIALFSQTIEEQVKKLEPGPPPLVEIEDDEDDEINTEIQKLVTSAPVMLFMKGTPDDPKCGFSRQIVEILNNMKADFTFFDVRNDETMKAGLKKFSNWPTFPQLYVNGELLGGLDVVRSLEANGELKKRIPQKPTLQERLKALINQHKCMIFMKGGKHSPKCGFSRQLMAMLNKTEVQFMTFDILTDEEVRQGLKELSNWPTYPQIYVNGELIGGLDIAKALENRDELVSTLQGP